MSIETVRGHLVDARSDAQPINSPALPAINAAIAECDAVLGGATLPAWRQGRQIDKVAPIVGAKFSPPGSKYSGPMHWHSFAIFDDGRVYGGMGTGHNGDKSQKGLPEIRSVYGGDFRDDAPTYKLLHAGTQTIANIPDYQTIQAWYDARPYRAYYPADPGGVPIRVPCQAYTSWQQGSHCHDSIERVFFCELKAPRSPLGGPNSRKQVDGFRLTGPKPNDWDAPCPETTPYPFAGSGTQWGDIPPTTNSNENAEPVFCRDPRSGKIYRGTGYGLAVFDSSKPDSHWTPLIKKPVSSGTHRYNASTWSGIWQRAAVIDVVRDRWVIIQGTGAEPQVPRIEWWPVQGGDLQFIPITGLTMGARTRMINVGNGLAHDLDRDFYILVLSSSNPGAIDYYWKVHPDTGKATQFDEYTPGAHGRVQGACKYIQNLGGVLVIPYADTDPVFVPTR